MDPTSGFPAVEADCPAQRAGINGDWPALRGEAPASRFGLLQAGFI
jgi:hypothetical protein